MRREWSFGQLRTCVLKRDWLAGAYHVGMTMTAADVAKILEWFRAAGLDVRLDGGWGVDALVGEQTRQHKDLDVIVRDEHEVRMREVLADHGFAQVRGVPRTSS